MTKDQAKKCVIGYLCEHFDRHPCDIDENTKLSDLLFTSESLVALGKILNKRCGSHLDPEDVAGCDTVGSVINLMA
jgi:acyl carrier protein